METFSPILSSPPKTVPGSKCPACGRCHQTRKAIYQCAMSPAGRHIPLGVMRQYMDGTSNSQPAKAGQ